MNPSNRPPQSSSTTKKRHTSASERRVRRRGAILVAVFLAAICAAGSTAAEEPEEFRIGGILHLTGEFSIQGQAFREGMELGAAAVQDRGGVPVKLVFEDTQYSAVRSVTAAKKLLSSDRVQAAVISTAVEAKAAGPEFQRAHVPAMVLWDSSPELEAIGDQIFAIGPWTPDSGQATADFAVHRIRAKTAAIVHTNTEWSASVADAFRKKFETLGGSIVSIAGENPSEADFRTTLLRAKRKAPDVFYVPVDANLIAFFHQIKQLNIGVPVITSDIITEDNLLEDATAFEGIYQSMPKQEGRPEAEDLFARYERTYHRPCTQMLFVSWGYDAVRVLADAALRAGKTPGKRLDAAVRSTAKFQGASHEITMNEHGSAPTPLSIFRIESGHFREVPGIAH